MRVAVSEETVAGTTNATPTMLVLETNDQTFAPNAPKAASAIIRPSDSRVKEMVPLNRSAAGGFSADLVYPTVNQGLWAVIRAGLNAAETAVATYTTSGDSNGIDNVDGSPVILRTTGDFTTDWRVGDIGLVSRASASADNRYFRVSAVEAARITAELADASAWTTPDTAVTLTRDARMIDNTATSDRSFSVECCWLDVQKRLVSKGQKVDSLTWSFAMGQPSKFSASFQGMDIVGSDMYSATLGVVGADYTTYAPTELPVFGPAQAIYVVVNGVSFPMSSLSITTSRTMRVRHSISTTATPDSIQPGTFTCTLNGSCYFAVVTAITQCTAGLEVPVWVVMHDGGGKALSFSMGTVMWDSAAVQTSGRNADEMVALTGHATNTSNADACLTFQRWQ